MATEVVVLPPGQVSLPELANEANREHALCEQAKRGALEHAWRAGDALIRAKASVAHGDWMPWLERHFEAAERTARAYMQLRRAVEDWQRVADLPLRDALKQLARGDRDEDDSGKLDVHFSSATDEWATPQDLFDALDVEFGFTLDVCALDSSAKCERYFTPQSDGLTQDWTGVCWMNPPYGDEIGRWVAKAHEAGLNGATVVCLVPARTDTGWWWDHCWHGEVRFLRGRLKFGNAASGAPFPSALVIFGREPRVIPWEWR